MSVFSTSNNNYTHLMHNPESRALYIFYNCVHARLFSLSFDKRACIYIYYFDTLKIGKRRYNN